MSSAICFNLNHIKLLSSGNGLTLPHNPDFMTLRMKTIENMVGKGENADDQLFLLFP